MMSSGYACTKCKRELMDRPGVRERMGEAVKKYRKTPKGKAAIARRNKKTREVHPERVAAWNKAQEVPISGHCVVCYARPAVHRHHEDYAQPEDVMLVCLECHHKIHGHNTFATGQAVSHG